MITSLCRTASPIFSCRAEWCRRALATSAHAETSSTSPMPPKQYKGPRTHGEVNPQNFPPRIFVRPWDGVPSMLDGFAMIRGIENEYGKVKAFRFLRVRSFRLRLRSDGLNRDIRVNFRNRLGRGNTLHVLFLLLGGAGRPIQILGYHHDRSPNPHPRSGAEKARGGRSFRPPAVPPTASRSAGGRTGMEWRDGTYG